MKTVSTLALILVVLVAAILPLGTPVAEAVGPERYAWSAEIDQDVRNVHPGETITIGFRRLWNRSNFTWNALDHDHPHHIHLSYHWYMARRQHAHNIDKGRLIQWGGLRSHFLRDVKPGEVLDMGRPGAHHQPPEMTVRVPQVSFPPGVREKWLVLAIDLVREGVIWFSQAGNPTARISVQVVPRPTPPPLPTYSAIYHDHNSTPSIMAAGSRARFDFAVRNRGSATWNRGGPNPVRASYHWYDTRGNVVIWEGLRTRLPRDVAPGQSSGVFTITIQAPSTPGTYFIKYDMVKEGVTWFSWTGAPMHVRQVIVR
jgi:hypothetical protein